ncbi:protein-glucosylgalactosylhydroxylysine glucosidase [Teleopsis dalmanni]|uniref:protein-glucosylgalactosylhydroxylysine glucosidase n=1 Tax=Teleopsis dalmanni TaxID=139649 RepID=UPI0018CC8085|nr:protein-glucosylgalactosylhydroxylysine glucosidase [Teleopsis dalmanni]
MFLLFLLLSHSTDANALQNDKEFLIETKSLPSDLNFMPTLSNGHLGYTVFGNAIFMNGVYNGHAGDSRRARIPNWLNVSVDAVFQHKTTEEDRFIGYLSDNATVDTAYTLNLRDGYFRWRQTYRNATGALLLQLEQRTYAHRFFNRALVYELLVQRELTEESLALNLIQKPGAASEAFNFTLVNLNNPSSNDSVAMKVLKGTTRVVENEQFQKAAKTVFIVFSDNFTNEKTLEMLPGQQQLYYRFIITADEVATNAVWEMQEVLHLEPIEMLRTHASEWQKFWQEFNITIQGNLELSKTINAGIFYLSSSLPALNTNQANKIYFGLSPTGLGRGELDADYEGHNFWDTEIWMLPAVTQMSTKWAEALLKYRLKHLSGARFNAETTGYKGARFPWESAFTGTEVTNPCCPEVAAQEIHISADIAFALQQHFAITNDRVWLCAVAWPLVRKIAAFLEDRVQLDAKTQIYHVRTVMGPDEDHWNIDDNVYTNVVFKIALEFASLTQAICSAKKLSNQNWIKIAKNLIVLYDEEQDFHPQHFGYKKFEIVKQADVILIGYPLQYPMNVSTRLNDLDYYVNVTRTTGPAMTWSMFAINFLDVKETDKADYYFMKGYRDYVRPEFKVWSERALNYSGSANFLTGIGGFLQAIINGYGGIRFYRKFDKSVMEINSRYLLPSTEAYSLNGIKFADAEFSLNISAIASTRLRCLKIGKFELELILSDTTYKIYEGYSSK